jgi:hypothetical protein
MQTTRLTTGHNMHSKSSLVLIFLTKLWRFSIWQYAMHDGRWQFGCKSYDNLTAISQHQTVRSEIAITLSKIQ